MPECFDLVAGAALQVSLPEMDHISDLKSPSNAIKLKYDLKRLVDMIYAYLLKNNKEGREVSDAKRFTKLMSLEWSERVTKLARTVLQQRKLSEKKELPSPEDIETLTRHLISQLTKIELVPELFQTISRLCQTRLLIYNKRRTGELVCLQWR